ncbi:MAG: PP2C family protein-serine/threonine phosphatase [Leptospira bouyouniensis]|uniref:Serine/threonine-protein phosphatase n=1 Tax=Leptospira bouyouniensis TaxID=2484911 RepID=A0A7I0HSC1_9LEPT|nr:PP2C family protein-serine/threonine phosphatase [Leptospira bouyouniensis]TGK52653.1 serine/threonine-protein phosphatase [Leptospira bouyouniensis]TGL06594.1 serine/threonine-protein phosphatase [Leptospira bouyouniensis]TGM85209.1 serine/threonine-protein phosphatase [Leptospira bouyouniensis]
MYRHLQTIVSNFLDLIPERKIYNLEYCKELDRQARIIQFPGSLIGSIALLGFAFDTDAKLHPEFPDMFLFRIGFTSLCVFYTIFILINHSKKIESRIEGLTWGYVVYGYVLFTTSYFTGRIADDAPYVSGLQMVVIILSFLPLPRKTLFFYYPISIFLFLTAVFIYKPNLNSPASEYSMQNLVLSYVLGVFSGLIIERYRFHSFLNHLRITKKNEEVTKAVQDLQTLKSQQDGDYFLTTLLFDPLIGKETDGTAVTIKTLLSQYKKFNFRNKEYQLGGDYLSVYNLILQGKRYKAFINGDAMGKSIQGAGGAIVLGAVYNSIVIRSKMDPTSSNRSPERWLHDCYLDLQKIFETFDGAMLVSAVLGLLEESTGTLYFINLEHPSIILYRDGKASFIEDEIHYYKLGVMEVPTNRFISVFQMQKGDKIFCGSDGKDDLVISESGRFREINENHNLILDCIEESKGDIETLVPALQSKGKFSDDFSIISLEYNLGLYSKPGIYWQDAKKLIKEKEHSKALDVLLSYNSALDISIKELKYITKLYEKEGVLLKAMEYASLALENYPSDTSWMFHTSVLYKRLYSMYKSQSFLLESQELSERVRLRQPNNIRNLIHLADVCRLIGDKDRTNYLVQILKQMTPENKKLQELISLL